MNSIFKIFNSKSQYFKNIIITLVGGGIAQLIPVLISPIIARLYAPNEFGSFSVVYTLGMFCAILITGRYQQAIFLTQDRKEIKRLISLCLILSIFNGFAIVGLILLLDDILVLYFKFEGSPFAFLFVPIIAFLASALELVNVLLIKEKKFKTNATNKIIMGLSNGSVQLLYPFFAYGFLGLVLGQVIASIMAILNSIKLNVRLFKYYFNKLKLSKIEMKNVAIKFRKFPIYDVPSNTFNYLSLQLPILTFSAIFDLTTLGFYSFANKLLIMPVNLLSKSILEVFKSTSSEDYLKYGECKEIFLKTFKTLFWICLIPFSILTFFGEEISVFIFGDNWKIAGSIIQILSPYIFLKAIISPITYTFYLAGKQRVDAILQFTFFILMIGIISYISFNKDIDLITTVQLITSLNVILYLIYFILSYKYSKGNKCLKNY